jgi:hypothetical protein
MSLTSLDVHNIDTTSFVHEEVGELIAIDQRIDNHRVASDLYDFWMANPIPKDRRF